MSASVGTKPGLPRSQAITSWIMSKRNPLWRVKLRLQFTGWLQYIAPGVVALIFTALAAIGWLIGFLPIVFFWLPAAIAAFLFAALVFDLVTVKAGIRPALPVPHPRDKLDAFDLMRARRSCRAFQKRNLGDADRTAILDAAREATQDLIGDGPVRLEYISGSLTVWPAVGAHEFLVAIVPREYDRLANVDVGRSLEKVVLRATRRGLATCWIGPGADHRSIVRYLEGRFDDERENIICVCAVGYTSLFKPVFVRLMQFAQHRRKPFSKLFFADPAFKQPLPVDQAPYSAFGRTYEACQWSPSSYNGQTTRCAAVVQQAGDERRLVRFDFAQSNESRYYAPVALGIWCANWETGCQALGIPGHFAVLTPQQRGISGAPELPQYDVSWVLDQPMLA